MIIRFTSPVYYFILIVCAALCVVLFAIFKNKSQRTKETFLFVLALLNVIQHLLKHVIYPHLRGTEFGLTNTAYNVCAIVILLTPFTFLTKNVFFRFFISCIGIAGGAGAIAIPVWFIGQTILQWEYLRFFVCHLLLLLTSLFPLLWKMRIPKWRDFWKAVPAFLILLCSILLNDVVVVCSQPDFVPEKFYSTLYELNPFGIMRPMGNFALLDRIFTALTPNCFLPTEAHPYYTPLLWCAIPLSLAVLILSLIVCCLFDRKAFVSDWKRFCAYVKQKAKSFARNK